MSPALTSQGTSGTGTGEAPQSHRIAALSQNPFESECLEFLKRRGRSKHRNTGFQNSGSEQREAGHALISLEQHYLNYFCKCGGHWASEHSILDQSTVRTQMRLRREAAG